MLRHSTNLPDRTPKAADRARIRRRVHIVQPRVHIVQPRVLIVRRVRIGHRHVLINGRGSTGRMRSVVIVCTIVVA